MRTVKLGSGVKFVIINIRATHQDVELHQEVDLFRVSAVRAEHLHLHAGSMGEEVHQWCHFQHPGPAGVLQLRVPAELHPETDQRLHADRQ